MLRIILLLLIILSLFFKAHNLSRDDFPSDFVFGSGSSAYQVEGAANQDGRTPSIWDTFAHAGHVHGNGDIACDQYHKFKEDVQLMVEIGLEAYRFSISWSRLIPNGRGPINPKGLQYYNNLINELINHGGIQPHVTLFHSDTPQALEDEYQGWLSRKAVNDFTAYADVCFREFGDRVAHWTTLNEPNAFAIAGYDNGVLPPGRCSAPFGLMNCSGGNSTVEPYLVAHHFLLAHASTARLYKIKYQGKQKGLIGLNLDVYGYGPLSNITEDEVATERANDFLIGWFLNPLVFGDYPVTMKKNADSRIPILTNLEAASVKGSFDFIGLNYYLAFYIKDQSTSLQLKNRDFMADMAASWIPVENDPFAYGEYPITPWGLLAVLNYIRNNYNNPLVYIHENGQATPHNSSLEDLSRMNYLQAHIGFLLDALRNGTNIGGYFQWSFLDLFELIDGYDTSFGLYYIDLDDPDLNRQPKLSSQWYSNFLKKKTSSSNGIIKSNSHDSLSYN